MDVPQKNKIPKIYCAISISFKRDADISAITDSLRQIGIKKFKVCTPKCEPVVCVDIAILKNEPFWYLDEALTKMFQQIENCMPALKAIIQKFQGKACIDVAFYQYGTYPALTFFGENMKKIRYLEADISIDPF